MSDIDPRMAAPPPEESPGSVRLIFEYDGDDVRLVARQTVDVVAPPGDPIEDQDRSGFWVELRARSEDVLYRQVLSDPGRVHPEVFSPDPAVGIARTPEPQTSGAFSVLVPAQEAGSHVVLMGSPSPPGSGMPRMAASPEAPAEEIARFSIEGTA
jgi:hypothetical protein